MKPTLLTTNKFAPPCASCPGFRKSPLGTCHQDDRSLLTSSRQWLQFAKGQTIFRDGSACTGLYCVQSGQIKVSKSTTEGKEQIVRLAASGDMLGVCSLLGEPTYRNSAVAMNDCAVCFLPRQDVLGMVQANGQFAHALLLLLSQAVHQADERLLQLASKPVRERLADALLLLQRTFRAGAEAPFAISISREDLAALMGTVKETVSRLVSEFKQEGIIATKGSKITILNEQRLVEIGSFYQ